MSLEAEVGYNLQGEITFDFESQSQELEDGHNLIGKTRKCSLCDKLKHRHIQRHVLGTHLPWYIIPTSACWHCKTYVQRNLTTHVETFPSDRPPHSKHYKFSLDIHLQLWCQLTFGILVFLASRLQLGSVVDLLGFVLAEGLFPQRIADDANFGDDQVDCLKKLCHFFDLTIPETFVISPPNHVVCILHWKILVKLLEYMYLNTIYTSDFKYFSLRVPRPLVLQLSFIDSHCHLDKIMKTRKFDDFSQLKSALSLGKPDLQLCISNFVFPRRWNTIEHFLDVSLVKGTIGVHPHAVEPGKEQEQVSKVAGYLRGSGFIGVGEVGLDFHFGYCNCKPRCQSSEACMERKKQAQLRFLHGVLPLADQHNLTLVLHCRDDGDGAASKEVRMILKAKKLTHLRIHLHCFIGSLEEMKNWLCTFPNVMFGITAKSLNDANMKASLTELQLEKILLETDSPYLENDRLETDTPGLEEPALSPWEVYLVAWKLYRERNISFPELVNACNQNALKLYGL